MLSINQLCDKGYKTVFDHTCWLILKDDKVMHVGNRKENIYKIKINAYMRIKSCLIANINGSFFGKRN